MNFPSSVPQLATPAWEMKWFQYIVMQMVHDSIFKEVMQFYFIKKYPEERLKLLALGNVNNSEDAADYVQDIYNDDRARSERL